MTEQCDQSDLSESENTAAEDNQPSKAGQILSGNKFFILLAGVRLQCNEDLTVQLRKKLPQLQEVKTVNECDFILVFCPVASRAGTDIEAAVKKLHDYSATKPAVLVVLHPTFDPESVVPDSSRAVNRENTITVDCLFYEDQGLLPCKKNDDAIKHIEMQIKPKIQNPVLDKGNKGQLNRNKRSEQGSSTQPCVTTESNEKPTEFREINDQLQGTIDHLKEFKNVIIEAEEKGLIKKEVIITTDLRLVLLGRTRSDKTAVQNIILGREERNQAATTTTTATQQSEIIHEVAGRKVTVVDTPDLPGISLEEIGQSVGPQAFLLVMPIEYFEEKMHDEDETHVLFSKMDKIFGERCWRNTMILFIVSDECQNRKIEEFTQSGDLEFQRLVGKCENRFHCLNIKESENGSQVSQLLEKIEKMVGGNRNGIEIYQTIRDTERKRHDKDARIREVQCKMQETLEKYDGFIKGYVEDLERLETCESNENKELVDKLKKICEIKRDIVEHMKEMYDKAAGLEEKRQFIKVILPENQQIIWISLPDEQS